VELSLERVGEVFDAEELVYAMRANKTVKHVCFSGTFVRELTPIQLRIMLEGVGHLETLEELQIWCATIPVSTFARMLRNAHRLRKVYFFRVLLAGSQDDFVEWSESIKSHPALSDFRFGGIQAVTETISMDCVIEALADAEHLQVVSLQLYNSHAVAPFSGRALARLLSSSSITDLYLTRLGLSQDHFVTIAHALTINKTLRVLDLFGNNLANDQVLLFAQALQNNEGLETFILPCPSDEDLRVDCSIAISEVLQVNKTLITLNLPRCTLSDIGLHHLAEGLTVNTTLKKIEVGVSKNVGDKGTAALTGMLEKNYELERLVVSSAEKSIKDKVEYYMRLNAVGRGSLLNSGHANRGEWVEMLISVRDDLDCLFYFTTMNPTVCQFANASGADVIITEEFKPMRRHSMLDGFVEKM
jgi:hypothetical protein